MDTTTTTLAPVSDLIAEYQSQQQSTDTSATDEVSKEMFLQLLVAQIQNQNPLNPADGLDFVSQLAEFSSLEQLIAIRDGVEALGEVPETAAAEEGAEETTPVDGEESSN